MAVVVVDSNILIDYKDTSADTRHKRAENIIHAFDSGDLPTARVTDYVLLESLNWIHTRQRHNIAVDLKNRLVKSAGFELVDCVKKDLTRALELFDTHESLSFGDATIAAYMHRTGIEHLYSFGDILTRRERLSLTHNFTESQTDASDAVAPDLSSEDRGEDRFGR